MKPSTTIAVNGTTTPTTAPDEWLTPADIAAELKLTVAFVYGEIQAGRLASVRIGKYLRVSRATLRDYLAERATGGGR